MKTKLTATGLALFACIGFARAQALVTNVPANPLWTDTGLYLTNGEWVTINGEGLWQYPCDPDGELSDDQGDEWLMIPNWSSLIAFIGADPYQGSEYEGGVFQTNQYLEIGTARQFMSSTNGELWLGVNDDAFSGTAGDNFGTNTVAVTLGITCDDNYSNMTLSVGQVTSNSFSFYISNGIPYSVCAIYDSADLTHWTLLDSLTLDNNGSSANATDNAPPAPGAGLQSGAYVNFTTVPYRFYKVSDGPFWSQAIGFERMTIGPGIQTTVGTNVYTYAGTNSIIADQLIAPANTLNGLLNPMVDGSTLPNGTKLSKWIGHSYNDYIYSSGSWTPNGNDTLLPGEAARIVLPTNSAPQTITFAGLVPQGTLVNYAIPAGNYVLISSMVPQAGGLQCPLGYHPNVGDNVLFWTGTALSGGAYTYEGAGVGTGLGYQSDWIDGGSVPPSPPSIPGDQTDTSDEVYWAPAPQLNVGQGFWFMNNESNTWIRKFPGCCDQ